MIDYPGKMSCVVFLSNCDFRCPFCHNPELIFNTEAFPDITVEEFFAFLDDRKKWIDAVCITGGEPTTHKGLVEFMRQVKAKGFSIKLDTNGSNPKIVEQAISEGIVDYIAMDIKNCQEKYSLTCGVKVNMENIQKSIKLIMDAGAVGKIDYEFRSTIMPKLHNNEDIIKMSGWLTGAKKFVLQNFKTEQALLDQSYVDEEGFLSPQLEEFRKIMEKDISIVEVRQ